MAAKEIVKITDGRRPKIIIKMVEIDIIWAYGILAQMPPYDFILSRGLGGPVLYLHKVF